MKDCLASQLLSTLTEFNYRDAVYCFSIHLYIIVAMYFHRVQHREHLLTPLPATDPGGTITMVTASGRSFTQQINTEDTAVQETNPAIPGQLVLANWSILKYNCEALIVATFLWFNCYTHVHTTMVIIVSTLNVCVHFALYTGLKQNLIPHTLDRY